jgi:hypothetical protein
MSGPASAAAWVTQKIACVPWGTPVPFRVRVLRQIGKVGGQGPCFGDDFLWALLAMRR